jgi:IS5 family transposase
MTDDFFRNRLDQMIDLRHPLAVLANRMPWQEIEASLAQRWARQVKAAKKIEDLDLFGPVSAVAGGGVSNAGRPRLPTRLMVALLYLKHAFNESDEEVIQRWGETPTWQYFSGNEYFEHQWPCDPTQLGRFRKALGEDGVEELLARTMEVAVTLKLIAKKELTRVIVDSTVQEKAVAHPTDSKLLETARSKVVEAAKAEGIELKQTYAKEGQLLGYKAGRYAHARQFKRMRKMIKRQRTIFGRLQREVARKMTTLSQAIQETLSQTMNKAKRLVELLGLSLKSEANPNGDITLAVTGLRPGEKLYEELLIGDNPLPTSHSRIMKAHEDFVPWDELQAKLSGLGLALDANDLPLIRSLLKDLVPGYQPDGEVVDWVWMENAKAA